LNLSRYIKGQVANEFAPLQGRKTDTQELLTLKIHNLFYNSPKNTKQHELVASSSCLSSKNYNPKKMVWRISASKDTS